MRTKLLRVGAIVGTMLGTFSSARADVDATGGWRIFFDAGFASGTVRQEWMQSGTTLTTSTGFSGTINPATGVFLMTKPATPCPDDAFGGTVSADGRTFTGNASQHICCSPTLCFGGLSYTVTGSRCDNGLLDSDEECDDGNGDDGDGCSGICEVETCFQCTGEPSVCSPEPQGTLCEGSAPCTAPGECDGSQGCVATSPPCDDHSGCTIDACNSGTCSHEPVIRSCRSAQKSLLLVVDNGADQDKLVWKWIKGQSTTQPDFADPQTTAAYELCLFSGTSAAIAKARVDADAQKWSPIGDKGYRYDDASGAQDGIQKVLLKGSDSDRTKIVLKGKGMNLPDVEPPLTLPITTQLRNTSTDACWSATYGAAGTNRTGKFKAKSTPPESSRWQREPRSISSRE